MLLMCMWGMYHDFIMGLTYTCSDGIPKRRVRANENERGGKCIVVDRGAYFETNPLLYVSCKS